MRRTYRSKKETGGALDHRDVLQNMDEKSSIFDAFYIQSIKQTKRELSCVTSSNVAGYNSKRVRKRKYVKKKSKDVNPVPHRETLSTSAYLTPDKSIRVNRILDPFDMLLNSSPANGDHNYEARHISVRKKESKTYARKKRANIKKMNYSYSDSSNESDKENDVSSNVTDLRHHDLLVEKSPEQIPKDVDQSIQNILGNLSLFTKTRNGNVSFNTSYKCRNRLNKINNSPVIQKSPLCSTPYKEKYRGVSIFKFSPIVQTDKITHSAIRDIVEENNESNHSIILCSKSAGLKPNCSKSSHLSQISNPSVRNDSILIVNNENASNSNQIKNSIICETNTDLTHDNKEVEESNSLQPNSEPFMGFKSDEIDNNLTEVRQKMMLCLEDIQTIQDENSFESSVNELKSQRSFDVEIEPNDLKLVQSSQNKPYVENNEVVSEMENVSINVTNDNNSSQSHIISDNESYYDTCNSEGSSINNDQTINKEPLVVVERMNDSLFLNYYIKMLDHKYEDKSLLTDEDDFESYSEDNKSEVSVELDNSNETRYKFNPIVITDSSTTEDVIVSETDISNDNQMTGDDVCFSFVTTRRRNEIKDITLDQSYKSSSTDCEKTVLTNNNVSLDNSCRPTEAIETLCDENNKLSTEHFKTDSIITVNTNNIIRNSTIILPQASDDNEVLRDDNFSPENTENTKISRISRRKNSRNSRKSNAVSICESKNPIQKRLSKVTKKSLRLTKRSYSISSESDNDKTVVNTNHNNDCVTKNINLEDKIAKENRNTKVSFGMDNISIMNLDKTNAENVPKVGIVLQPGKKWERSLSIYRRITMAEQDHSILEESMLNKGRKYRQSLIATMEMQKCRDSFNSRNSTVHDDTLHSQYRRSTFVSNTSRSTIRFVKDPNISRASLLNTSSDFDDLKGFLSEECNDTVVELSKLSIADDHEVTVLDKFHEERVTTARDFVLRRCNQTEPILFDECYPETVLKNCHKIGEGVYGEVYLWRARDGVRVMKIVPIAGTVRVNGEPQKDYHEIISEIVIAMELSALRAPIADIERQLDEGSDIHALDLHHVQNATDVFNQVLAVRCVYGPYPSRLLDLWELYDECRGSENDSPAALPADQRYIVLELANAGQDLESFQFAGAHQAHALFQQLAFGLAVAEEALQFEHRDLHWGNVLIAPTEQKVATFVLRGRTHAVPRRGVACTVIDYSLSRVTLADCALYNDLAADPQLFDAVGDRQFEVYRLMRDKLGNDWKNFEPYTNVLWLHYVVDKMITALRYKRTNTKIHKHYIEKLSAIRSNILEYGSAVDFVLNNIEF